MSASIPLSRPARLASAIAICLLTLAAAGFGLTRLDLMQPGPAAARVLGIFYGYWVAVVFILLQIGIGTAVLPHLRANDPGDSVSKPTQTVLAFAVGSYATYMFLLVAAIADGLSIATVCSYCALAVLAILYALWNARRLYKLRGNEASGEQKIDAQDDRPRTGWLWLSVAGIWCIPFVLQTTLPNTDWDGALFHLPFANQIIDAGVLATDPLFDANNYPAAMQLIYAAFLLIGAKTAILPYNFLVACGILVVLYCLGREFWNARLGWLAVLVGLTVNVLWEVAITPRIDSFLAFYSAAAVLVFMLWRRDRSRRAPAGNKTVPDTFSVVVGMMLGMTLGMKYTAVFLVVVLVPLAIFAAAGDKLKSGTRLVAPVLLAAAFAVVPSGFWYVRNAIQLGDPIYPFLNKKHVYRDSAGRVQSLKPALAALTVNELTGQQIRDHLKGSPFEFVASEPAQAVNTTPGNLFNLWDAYKRPTEYARKPLHTAGPFVLLFFLVPLVARDRPSWLIFAIGLPLYLLIASQTFLVRYLAPVLPLFAFGAALVAFRFGERVKKRVPWIAKTLALLAIAFLVSINITEWKKLALLEPLRFWTGRESEEEFVARVGYNRSIYFSRFMQGLNEKIRRGVFHRDAKVIMIGEGCADLLLCDYKGDMSWNALPWQVRLAEAEGDIDHVTRILQAEGYDHVLVNYRFLKLCYDGRSNAEQRQKLRWSLYQLNSFLRKHTETVSDEYGILLAKLDTTSNKAE